MKGKLCPGELLELAEYFTFNCNFSFFKIIVNLLLTLILGFSLFIPLLILSCAFEHFMEFAHYKCYYYYYYYYY